jgi:hypothetical protein
MSTRLSFDVFQMGFSGRIEQAARIEPRRARAAIFGVARRRIRIV